MYVYKYEYIYEYTKQLVIMAITEDYLLQNEIQFCHIAANKNWMTFNIPGFCLTDRVNVHFINVETYTYKHFTDTIFSFCVVGEHRNIWFELNARTSVI